MKLLKNLLLLPIICLTLLVAAVATAEESIEDIRRQAELGDAAAQLDIGIAYALGKGVEKNLNEAARWYRKAAEQGNAKAQFHLALSHVHGVGSEKDMSEAVRWFRKAAEQGDVEAQFNFGIVYARGKGVEKDMSKAVYWYRKAAEQGDAEAQLHLGNAYYAGKGVEEDKNEAVRWHRKAAEQGHAVAQFILGSLYDSGTDVKEDKYEAVRWFRKAAEQGHAAAQYSLGSAYFFSNGVKEDKNETVRWYRKAGEQGHLMAQYMLGIFHNPGSDVTGIKEDKHEATRWFRKAAEQGHVESQFILSDKERYEEDKSEAVHWLRKAAEQGHAVAQGSLGFDYYYGKGVKEDKRKAVRWTRKAAEQGIAVAQYSLGLLYWLGEGIVENKYESYVWHLIAKANGNKSASENLQQSPWSNFLTEAEIRSAKREATRRFAEIEKRQEQEQSTNNSLSADIKYAIAKPPSEINIAAKVFENTWRSIVMIEDGERQGSGVVIRPNLVATACHVVDGGDIVIYKPDNKQIDTNISFHATIRHRDDARDFCILEVDGLWSIPATIRKYDTLNIGENVYAIGAPQGLDMSLSDGLVSQLRNTKDGRVIQTNAAVSPGSSGGGLFDTEGNLIGIVTSKRIDENTDGIAFAIPADLALEI